MMSSCLQKLEKLLKNQVGHKSTKRCLKLNYSFLDKECYINKPDGDITHVFPCGAMANSMFNDTIFIYDGEFTETNLIEQVANPASHDNDLSPWILKGDEITWTTDRIQKVVFKLHPRKNKYRIGFFRIFGIKFEIRQSLMRIPLSANLLPTELLISMFKSQTAGKFQQQNLERNQIFITDWHREHLV